MQQPFRFTVLLCVVIVSACKQPGKTSIELTNESIVSSNSLIEEYNKSIYEVFSEKLHNMSDKPKADIWAPKAGVVREQSRLARLYTERLRTQLTKAVTLNDDTRTSLFLHLLECKRNSIQALHPEEFSDNPYLQKYILKAQIDFWKTLPVLKGFIDSSVQKAWIDSSFNTTIDATFLNKLDNDLLVAENKLIRFCLSNTYSLTHPYNQFATIAVLNSKNLKHGQQLQVTAGVGSFSEASAPKIYINDKLVALNSNSVAEYSFIPPNKPGKHSVKVSIHFTMPDGTNAIKEQNLEYFIE